MIALWESLDRIERITNGMQCDALGLFSVQDNSMDGELLSRIVRPCTKNHSFGGIMVLMRECHFQ